MSGHDVERAYVAAVLDQLAAGRDQALEETRAEVDRLRESWASGYEQQLAGHEDRMQAMRDETRAFLRSYIDDDEATEPASTQDVPQGRGRQDVSGAEPATASSGPGPGELNPRAAELAAEDIKAMSWAEYSALRTTTGIANGGGRGIFG